MKGNKVTGNIFYNMLYRIITMLIPLITAPYISRVLGPEGVGVFSYTNAIAYYFFLAAMLGVNDYGVCEIAKVRDDKKKLSETFWQIYYIQFFLCILLSSVYILFVSFKLTNYLKVAYIQAIYILSVLTDINWLAYGIEEFKFTSIRSSIVKIVTAVSFFIFVKSANDVWKYALIIQLGNVLSLVVLWTIIQKRIYFVKPNYRQIVKHLKGDVLLFLPYIASSLYVYVDKLMLGNYDVSKTELGYYQSAENIINIPMAINIAVCTAMLPTMSNMVANGDGEKTINTFNRAFDLMSCLNIAMAFGMAAVAQDFIPFYLGENYQRTAYIIIFICPIICLNGMSDILRTNFFLPRGKGKMYTASIIIGALTNVMINVALIPKHGGVGAAIATTSSSFITLIVQYVLSKKEIELFSQIKNIFIYLVSGLAMVYLITCISNILDLSSVLKVVIEVGLGVVCYTLLILMLGRIFKIDISLVSLINRRTNRM